VGARRTRATNCTMPRIFDTTGNFKFCEAMIAFFFQNVVELENIKINPVRGKTPRASADAQAHRTSNRVKNKLWLKIFSNLIFFPNVENIASLFGSAPSSFLLLWVL